jgi:ribulose bisphosphate carboxylase small subunit
MTTLRDAREGKLDKFIKEHEADPDGDLDKLDDVIKRPTQESGKEAPPTSSQDASDD